MSKGPIFTLDRELWLPKPAEQIFPFFADAANLEAITPRFLSFRVVTPGPIEMKEGTIIDYRLKVRGLPIRWRTRISLWRPPHCFRDEALISPYRQWIHTHTFEPRDGGTLCRDHVEYAVPGGRLVHTLLVRRDVEKIFDYRTEKLRELFGDARPDASETAPAAAPSAPAASEDPTSGSRTGGSA